MEVRATKTGSGILSGTTGGLAPSPGIIISEVQGWVILGQQGPDFFMSLSSTSGVLAPHPSKP